jgi:hypothetical protein
MRESTIEQINELFIVRLYEKVLIKVVSTPSRTEAEFITRCWDSGIFSRDEFEYMGL